MPRLPFSLLDFGQRKLLAAVTVGILVASLAVAYWPKRKVQIGVALGETYFFQVQPALRADARFNYVRWGGVDERDPSRRIIALEGTVRSAEHLESLRALVAGLSANHDVAIDAVCVEPAVDAPDVPLPETTPYDDDRWARRTYLEAYRDGYRLGRMGGWTSCHLSSSRARTEGWYAGEAAGRRDGRHLWPPFSP